MADNAPDKRLRDRSAKACVDKKLDEGLEESFPASDPPAMTNPTIRGGSKRASERPENEEKKD